MGSRYPVLMLRTAAAVVSFVIATILAFIPGPAIPFWILGFVLLGYGAGEILLSFEKVQAWLHRHVPFVDRLPRYHRRHTRRILRNPWIRYFESVFSSRTRRDAKRRKRRAERRKRQPPKQ